MPLSEGDVRLTVRALQPLVGGLAALGAEPAPILRAAGIRPEALDDPDVRVRSKEVGSFWARAVDATGDDMLGLHLAEAAPIETFDVHAYALLSSRTLREAYRRASRYQRLIHETTRLDFVERPGYGTLIHALPGGRPVARHPAEFLATAWVRVGRMVLDRRWLPEGVYFAHEAPPDTSEHDRFFGARVHFEAGKTALRVADETLDKVSAAPDDRLAAILDRHVGALLASRPSRESLSDRVLTALGADLQSGSVNARVIARRLHMSERTLRRGLAEEGTNYRGLLERLRRERAMALLSGRRCSIAEIAYLLGFSEVSAFHRAFKRWTGKTPAEVRSGATVEGSELLGDI